MNLKLNFSIREIEPSDNKDINKIIKAVSAEFESDPKTTIAGDPCIDHMYENYIGPGSIYYVVESSGEILGGCGINKLVGSIENICELQRMFLLPSARGIGLGEALLNLCIEKAIHFGYDKIYLETLSQMNKAINLYQKLGFSQIDLPLGSTGHTGCNVYMILNL